MVETSVRIGIIFLPTDCTGPAELHTIIEKCYRNNCTKCKLHFSIRGRSIKSKYL